eukprot:scaffold161462_cov32-Tisochrysis_lutea.AAC.2
MASECGRPLRPPCSRWVWESEAGCAVAASTAIHTWIIAGVCAAPPPVPARRKGRGRGLKGGRETSLVEAGARREDGSGGGKRSEAPFLLFLLSSPLPGRGGGREEEGE